MSIVLLKFASIDLVMTHELTIFWSLCTHLLPMKYLCKSKCWLLYSFLHTHTNACIKCSNFTHKLYSFFLFVSSNARWPLWGRKMWKFCKLNCRKQNTHKIGPLERGTNGYLTSVTMLIWLKFSFQTQLHGPFFAFTLFGPTSPGPRIGSQWTFLFSKLFQGNFTLEVA